MKPLDLFEAPLDGMNLIEASAGTGKTYTIAGLYLRLVVERALPVENILVVTFTKAATAELKERLRSKLVEVRRAFELGAVEEIDEFSATLLARCADHQQAYRLLSRALLDFDRAAIFTIHGFCQRVLSESAYESGQPFRMALMADDEELVLEVVDDFWRLHLQDRSPGLQNYLAAHGVTPDSLAQLLRGRLGRPYLRLRGQSEPTMLDRAEWKFDQLFSKASQEWISAADEIKKLLLEAKGLNGNKYRKTSIEKWCRLMENYLGDTPGEWSDNFHKFTTGTLNESLKKGGIAPVHPFFESCQSLLEQREQLQQAYDELYSSLAIQLIDYVNRELAERKSQARVQSYNDLLLRLNRALEGTAGESLARMLRQRYRVALIDEFQDTDPVQYGIFRRIYGAEREVAYLVGDPKQAIYSFRGADIFAYIEARGEAEAQFTLDTNWRSAPQLINGVNALFSVDHGGFLFREIPFQPALPAPGEKFERKRLEEQGGAIDPLRIGHMPGQMNKEQATQWAVDWTAGEINRLLEAGRRGEITLGGEPLASKDIAVLVRSHAQGSRIRAALDSYGIFSVLRSQDDVFQSPEALDLERLMSAVVEPGREFRVRTALATDLLGLDGNDIYRLSQDENELETHLETFRRYHQAWREKGFIRMFRLLLREQDLPARLRSMENGERRLTNLLHLGELLHRAERAERPSMEGLVKWLSQRRAGERPEDEEHQLRLESDEKLVQIVTIHKSKGLQYPVVFCPFLWSGGLRADDDWPVDFHDPDEGYQAVLDLGSDEMEMAKQHALREEMSENLRLLYVALTRAQERCYLLWGKVLGAGHSALGWLLHPPSDPGSDDALQRQDANFKSLTEDDLQLRLGQWASEAGEGVQVAIAQPVHAQVDENTAGGANARGDTLNCRILSREIQRDRRVTSFSALTVHGSSVELPDHDAGLDGHEVAEETSLRLDIFTFPRGARPGSCLHAIFENIDFTDTDRATLEQVVSDKLIAFGFDGIWLPCVSAMVRNVLDSELDAGVALRNVSTRKRFVELEFYFPLASIDGAGLAALLRRYGYGEAPCFQRAIEQLKFQDISGYMKGFIDLVFEADGRFYLLDYKSNWLGPAPRDYAQERMEEVMARHYYFLQYLLYTLALHRYLKTRLADYDYDRHFGGVYYLFLRGMDAESPGHNGIYRTRPGRELVEALESYICAEGEPL
ncbi:exodeoxyribonuclease V subunit beta [Solemya velesiana gill symbiont]|uniref:RecBCD enzyme subunit RecB n=1 Tax=Solemya velesiana gill symbiont TaxID=1918948 RepID=A0A1T2KSX6_9GAMM|nr:exodeoxyribonuclease V subunit beta [Solemya velesiana gill symbiont]OOZ35959.1 exodeoxyribonuclease V subunit beta [Solemya velesiana gill symbiont]